MHAACNKKCLNQELYLNTVKSTAYLKHNIKNKKQSTDEAGNFITCVRRLNNNYRKDLVHKLTCNYHILKLSTYMYKKLESSINIEPMHI